MVELERAWEEEGYLYLQMELLSKSLTQHIEDGHYMTENEVSISICVKTIAYIIIVYTSVIQIQIYIMFSNVYMWFDCLDMGPVR